MSDMKQQYFEKWLNSQDLSRTSIYNYLRGLRYIKKDLGFILKKFNVNSAFDLKQADIEEILNIEEFITYDKKGNRMCSSALKKYILFLDVTNTDNSVNEVSEDNYRKWMIENSGLKEKTIGNYISAIRDLNIHYKTQLVDGKEFNLFDIRSENRINEILTDPDFLELNLKWNSTHMTAIKYYKKYLSALNVLEIEINYEFKHEDTFNLQKVYEYIQSKGFIYSKEALTNFYLSLRSKPFVILSGVSGTGKTKIAELFAEAVGANLENGRFQLIPVRPDWSDGSELLGYIDLKSDFVPGKLTEVIIKAKDNSQLPYFVVLDEMNLARVEYYLSDFLSVVESRKLEGDEIITSPIVTVNEETYLFPNNLYIIGTVNMDETTYPFSKKVLDRANTITFNKVDLTGFGYLVNENQGSSPQQVINDDLKSKYVNLKQGFNEYEEEIIAISKELEKINAELKTIHAQIGYRVRDEICFYMIHNIELSKREPNLALSREQVMDYCIMQKILPRISGTGEQIETVLRNLRYYLGSNQSEEINEENEGAYPQSSAKIREMLKKLTGTGYTSFWIA